MTTCPLTVLERTALFSGFFSSHLCSQPGEGCSYPGVPEEAPYTIGFFLYLHTSLKMLFVLNISVSLTKIFYKKATKESICNGQMQKIKPKQKDLLGLPEVSKGTRKRIPLAIPRKRSPQGSGLTQAPPWHSNRTL